MSMAPYTAEALENIRRTAERGLKLAHSDNDEKFVDVFQHILDIVGDIKEVETYQWG